VQGGEFSSAQRRAEDAKQHGPETKKASNPLRRRGVCKAASNDRQASGTIAISGR